MSRVYGFKNDMETVSNLMTAALMLIGGFTAYLYYKKRMTDEIIINIIVFAGCIMRIGYMLYTHAYERMQDCGGMDFQATGHYGYIINIMQGHLPESNEQQFYHPPLYHAIHALVSRIYMIFTDRGLNSYDTISSAQFLPCIFSCSTLLIWKNLIKELEIKDKHRIWVMMIPSFLPNTYLMAARMNNDSLVTMFMSLCIMYTYRWYKDKSLKNIIKLAISYGLGMMTKISCGSLALFTGSIMIYSFVIDKNKKELFKQYMIFALICFPLALWYPIRNYILFDQPLGYVLEITDPRNKVADVPVLKRLFYLDLPTLMQHPMRISKFRGEYDTSLFTVPNFIAQSSLYGEFFIPNTGITGIVFSVINLFLMILSFCVMIWTVVKNKVLEKKYRIGFFALWVIFYAQYLVFNVQFPYWFTADFRYIQLTAFIGSLYIGYFMRTIENYKYGKQINWIIKCAEIMFAACSVSVYVM